MTQRIRDISTFSGNRMLMPAVIFLAILSMIPVCGIVREGSAADSCIVTNDDDSGPSDASAGRYGYASAYKK